MMQPPAGQVGAAPDVFFVIGDTCVSMPHASAAVVMVSAQPPVLFAIHSSLLGGMAAAATAASRVASPALAVPVPDP